MMRSSTGESTSALVSGAMVNEQVVAEELFRKCSYRRKHGHRE
jgi:hypothetical protein